MLCSVSGWFGIRVGIISFFLMLVLYTVCIFSRGYADNIILAMLITSVIDIQSILLVSLRTYMMIESIMVSAARCMNMVEVPQEEHMSNEERVSKDYPLHGRDKWPEEGVVEFMDASLKYRPGTDTVLHKLNFKIGSGEKIGVVGRTGAGKSTICLALSRIVEIFEG